MFHMEKRSRNTLIIIIIIIIKSQIAHFSVIIIIVSSVQDSFRKYFDEWYSELFFWIPGECQW